MKKLSAVLSLAMTISLAGLSAHGLDQRISITASKDLALNGTYVNVSSGHSVGEASNYNWSNFKYEVHQESESLGQINGQISQGSFAQCPGQFSLDSSSLRTCDFSVRLERMIIGAPGTNGPGNLLKLTAVGPEPVSLRVRSWLDLDGDNRASAFEPTSLWRSINFIPAEVANPFVNFSVTPPLLVNRELEAFVGDGGNPQAGLGLLSLTDVSNLKVRLVSCDGVGCESTFVSGVFAQHPQFGTYRFIGARTNWDTGRYRFELLYTTGVVDDYVLAAQEFDYLNRSVISVDTEILTNTGIEYSGPILNLPAHWQQAKSLGIEETTFTYSAVLKDASGKPVSGAEVNLYVDLKEITGQTLVRADGVVLQPQSRDEVLLKRVTDENGRVTVQFENPSPNDRDQMSINLSTQGLLATEYRGEGGREFVIWERDRKAVLALSGGSSSGGTGVELVATLLGEAGVVQNHTVGFSAEFPLVLQRTAGKTDSQGKTRSLVRLSHLASGSGSQIVTVFSVYDSKAVTASFEASWDATGAKLELKPLARDLEQGLKLSHSGAVSAKPGSTTKISPTLTDASGVPITSSSLTGLVVNYQGPGSLLSQAPSATDSKGNINLNLSVGSQESGEGLLTLTFLSPATGGLVVKSIKVIVEASSATVTIGSFNGKVVIYAKGSEGSRLTARVAGRWYSKTLTRNFDSLSVLTRPGTSVAISTYLDGRLITSRTLTAR